MRTCFFQRPLPVDPFELIESKAHGEDGCVFLSGLDQRDAKGCYEGHADSILELVGANITTYPANVKNLIPGTIYWGGWHVGSIRFFTSDDYLAVAKHVNSKDGIYTRRWSDQGHFPLAVAFLRQKNGKCTHTMFSQWMNDGLFDHMHGRSKQQSAKGLEIRDKCVLHPPQTHANREEL